MVRESAVYCFLYFITDLENRLFDIVISSPLHKSAESVSVRRRRQGALVLYDAGFTQDVAAAAGIEGGPSSQWDSKGVWEVAYCLTAQGDSIGTGEFGLLLTFCARWIFFHIYIIYK